MEEVQSGWWLIRGMGKNNVNRLVWLIGMPTCFIVNLPASNVHYVIYGCSLLMRYPGHAMHQGNNYGYGRDTVGFDVYANGPIIKDLCIYI